MHNLSLAGLISMHTLRAPPTPTHSAHVCHSGMTFKKWQKEDAEKGISEEAHTPYPALHSTHQAL